MSSSCTGAYTAEVAAACVVKVINDSGLLPDRCSFKSVRCHDSCQKQRFCVRRCFQDLGLCLFATEEMDHSCQQLIIDNHKWMHSSLPSMGLLPCIFGNILDQLVGGGHGHTGDFVQKSESVEVQGLTSKQQCSTHGRECSLQEPVQIDVSGLPCPDNSRANRKRKYEEGPSGLVYITWAQRHKMNQTPLLLIENVPEA